MTKVYRFMFILMISLFVIVLISRTNLISYISNTLFSFAKPIEVSNESMLDEQRRMQKDAGTTKTR